MHLITNQRKASGVTTEISLLVVYCLGIIAGLGYFREVMAVVAVTTTLLSLKGKLRFYIKKITQNLDLDDDEIIKKLIFCEL